MNCAILPDIMDQSEMCLYLISFVPFSEINDQVVQHLARPESVSDV